MGGLEHGTVGKMSLSVSQIGGSLSSRTRNMRITQRSVLEKFAELYSELERPSAWLISRRLLVLWRKERR